MGKHINEIDDTNVILNGKCITDSVLLRCCLPKFCPVLFASDLTRMPKTEVLKIIGQ